MTKNEGGARNHGLQRPFHKQQIFAWVMFGVEVIISYTTFLPSFEIASRIVLAIIFAILQCILFFFAFKATRIDPTDQAVLKERATKEVDESLKHYCTLCSTRVGSRSKHCGQCNRCVQLFDHHCFWLNNCIGEANYKHFIGSILTLFIMAAYKITLAIYIIAKFFKNAQVISEGDYSLSKGLGWTIIVFVILSMILNVVIFGLFLELLILHAWLKKKNMTTYEYIILRRERKAQKSQAAKDQQTLQSNQQDATLETGMTKHQGYKSKVIKKTDDQSSSMIDNSMLPLNNGGLDASTKKQNFRLSVEDRSASNLSLNQNQKTQISKKEKEYAPTTKVGQGENSFEISEISRVEEEEYKEVSHKTVSHDSVKLESVPRIRDNTADGLQEHESNNQNAPDKNNNHKSNNGGQGLESSMCNVDAEVSRVEDFKMSDMMQEVKGVIQLKNPHQKAYNIRCSVDTDDKMADYVLTPSVRMTREPNHFEVNLGSKNFTEPDVITPSKKQPRTSQNQSYSLSQAQQLISISRNQSNSKIQSISADKQSIPAQVFTNKNQQIPDGEIDLEISDS